MNAELKKHTGCSWGRAGCCAVVIASVPFLPVRPLLFLVPSATAHASAAELVSGHLLVSFLLCASPSAEEAVID
ncbi:MAG: hypothetical protein IJT51_04190 [Bacteroidales bacterium]|nr:hypothetical protein [Bacteroidales bacterium]